jgi:ankyrin repeat protein
MVNIIPPYKPNTPDYQPGMAVSVKPSPHARWLDDYEYYDQLGRDPLQQRKIWSLTDDTERVEQLRKILDEYPKQKHRRQILFTATGRGDEAIVRCLVETGLRVHPNMEKAREEERKEAENIEDEKDDDAGIPDTDDVTVVPLHVAANKGMLGCLKIFIESGVDVDVRDDIGRTPLIAACNHAGHREVIEYLIGQGADPTVRTNTDNLAEKYLDMYTGASALEFLAKHGDVETLRLLLDHPLYGSITEKEDRDSEKPGVYVTPLAVMAAAGGGSVEALRLLLERGAYPLEGRDGKTKGELLNKEQRQAIIDATPRAIEYGDLQSLKLLLSYQYPVDEHGELLPFQVPEEWRKTWTWGTYNAMATNNQDKFDYLYSFGLKEHDSMSLDPLPEGQTLNIQHLLDEAAQHGSVESVKLLVDKYGADPDTRRYPSCIKPLYIAAANDKTEVVRYLLDNHAIDIHAGNGRFAAGPTALWGAITLKSFDSIALLLQHGGPLNRIDDEIRDIDGPITAILRALPESRVCLETEANVEKWIWSSRNDFQISNPYYVRVELTADDKTWIDKLQIRKSDEELRETGEGARELNLKEGAKLSDLSVGDPRRLMAPYPTIAGRAEKLEGDNDLLPAWRPAYVPVEREVTTPDV